MPRYIPSPKPLSKEVMFMGIDIRFPNITATDTEGKMLQMQSYMHQLVEQLNWALSTVDNAIQGNTANVVMPSQMAQKSEEEAVNTFNSIKALIIKSADIVTAYEDVMTRDFNGTYFAESDFGDYLEKTTSSIEENSHKITETFNKVETITKDDGSGRLDKLEKDVNGYINRGWLGKYPSGDLEGQDAFGIAVGETTDGVYKNYAWFTSKRLSFFDENFNEVAYIGSSQNSSSKLYINTAHFLGNVQMGGYIADTSDGIAFLWGG